MRRAMSFESVEQRSYRIMERIRETMPQGIRTILFYVPVNREVDILPLSLELLQKGYTVLFPRVVSEAGLETAPLIDPEWDFQKGAFNIPEPRTEAYHGPIDLALIPGLVFDEAGYRLGYGRGYFDRFLAHGRCALTWGVSFRFQVLPRLPHTDTDIPVNAIVNEDGFIQAGVLHS